MKPNTIEIIGENVLRQLNLVVPDFFDSDYVVAKLEKQPIEEQGPGYPHVRFLHPLVLESTTTQYLVGSVLDVLGSLANIVGDGTNVLLLPHSVEGSRLAHDQGELPDLLETQPVDRLVIAEVSGNEGFGELNTFYKFTNHFPKGPRFPFSATQKGHYLEAICKNETAFAFIQTQSGDRGYVTIRENWEVRKLPF